MKTNLANLLVDALHSIEIVSATDHLKFLNYIDQQLTEQPPQTLRIEVETINRGKKVVKCVLWATEGSAVIYMKLDDYKRLMEDGFFMKDYIDTTASPSNETGIYHLQKDES